MLEQQQLAQIICAHGATISTTRNTLQRAPSSLLALNPEATADSDEKIVRILVEALRRQDMSIIVSESFDQWARLAAEVSKTLQGIPKIPAECSEDEPSLQMLYFENFNISEFSRFS